VRFKYIIIPKKAKILFDLLGKAKDRIYLKIAREENLTLSAKKVLEPKPKNPKEKPQTPWAAINAAHKIASEKPESLILVRIYNEARTFFQNSV
jgi:hypothetical protein